MEATGVGLNKTDRRGEEQAGRGKRGAADNA